jgi:hypothetical protein
MPPAPVGFGGTPPGPVMPPPSPMTGGQPPAYLPLGGGATFPPQGVPPQGLPGQQGNFQDPRIANLLRQRLGLGGGF